LIVAHSIRTDMLMGEAGKLRVSKEVLLRYLTTLVLQSWTAPETFHAVRLELGLKIRLTCIKQERLDGSFAMINIHVR